MLSACRTCGELKARTEFGTNNSYSDGRQRHCKPCWADRCSAYTARNRKAVAETKRAHKQRLFAADPEKVRTAARLLRDRKRDDYNARQREIYWADPEKRRAWMRAWFQKNPERARIRWMKDRQHRRDAVGCVTPTQLAARIDYWGGRCWVCYTAFEEIDHVIPVTRGGTHWPANLRPICKSCNTSKGAKDWRRWLPVRRASLRVT